MQIIDFFIYFFYTVLPGRNALQQPDTEATTQLVRQNEFRRLVDFEDHLSDISKDWLNCSL